MERTGLPHGLHRVNKMAGLLCLSLPPIFNPSLANTITDSVDPWVIEYAECHETIMRYLEWHSIALALGSEIEDIDHQWLIDTGLLNDEPLAEFQQTFSQAEQNIDSIDTIAATCSDNPDSLTYNGQLTVNSTLQDGSAMVRVFTVQERDSYSIQTTRFKPPGSRPIGRSVASKLSAAAAVLERILPTGHSPVE